MPKNDKRIIDGILLLDKPSGITSNRALQQVKHLFQAKKAGHTGALDPIATGVLPIFLGQATKLSQFLLNADKRYQVQAKLGYTSSTGDSEGTISKYKITNNIVTDDIAIDGITIDGIATSGLDILQIKKTLLSFLGKSKQIPPMYSALKQDGTPLYKLARQGLTVPRAPRDINITQINLIDFTTDYLTLDVLCSKGTYIRTLVADIGEKLGCGAFVTQLRRTACGHFNIENSHELSTLEKLKQNQLDDLLLSSEFALPQLPSISLDDQEKQQIFQGQHVTLKNAQKDNDSVKLFHNKILIGIGSVQGQILKTKRLLVNQP